jgi:hypothetical protein
LPACCFAAAPFAQSTQSVVDAIVQEETNNSQLPKLAHELFDGIGPRLVGTPQMKRQAIGRSKNIKAGALMPKTKTGAYGVAGNAAYHILI